MSLDETIFLTGFPGFIAGRLLRRLASDGGRFLLLVQPPFIEKARQEIVEIAGSTDRSTTDFQVVEGDITKQELGLTPADAERVRAEATRVFHLAALYDLGVTREAGFQVNVMGTRNVNEFSRGLRQLRHYHYVSTCYVAGNRRGRILESELEHNAGFRNYYEETKYLAEMEVDALKSELPITIHRPAVVCGDSVTGETAKYDGVYYLICYLLRAPALLSLFNIGNVQVKLNLVPVDFVVEALAVLAREPTAIGKTVQLADSDPLTTNELFETIVRALGKKGPRITLPAGLVEFSLMLPPSPAITGLPHPAVPYFFVKQTYDTTQARQLLDPTKVRCPPFPSYAATILDYAARHPRP